MSKLTVTCPARNLLVDALSGSAVLSIPTDVGEILLDIPSNELANLSIGGCRLLEAFTGPDGKAKRITPLKIWKCSVSPDGPNIVLRFRIVGGGSFAFYSTRDDCLALIETLREGLDLPVAATRRAN